MTDLAAYRVLLADFTDPAAGVYGRFSYGDVPGDRADWAHSAMLHSEAQAGFEAFFGRPDIFSLGVCNRRQLPPAQEPGLRRPRAQPKSVYITS